MRRWTEVGQSGTRTCAVCDQQFLPSYRRPDSLICSICWASQSRRRRATWHLQKAEELLAAEGESEACVRVRLALDGIIGKSHE
jgi:hypothetical protein